MCLDRKKVSGTRFILVQDRTAAVCSVLCKQAGSRRVLDLNLLLSQHLVFF